MSDVQETKLLAQEAFAQMKTVPNPEGKNQYTEVRRQNDAEPNAGTRARDIVAKAHDVGTRTVDRAISFSKGLDSADSVYPGFKAAILTGTVKAPKSVIASLQKMEEPGIN
ncbi:MAG: hypothetical protein VB071_09210 [Lawsonibacter sp.]|nr:hypothetical protein [Lawsonibacter sp.]